MKHAILWYLADLALMDTGLEAWDYTKGGALLEFANKEIDVCGFRRELAKIAKQKLKLVKFTAKEDC